MDWFYMIWKFSLTWKNNLKPTNNVLPKVAAYQKKIEVELIIVLSLYSIDQYLIYKC